jgi:hypothetical protein
MALQTVLFSKAQWTRREAEEWLRGHRGFKLMKERETANYWRFRQRKPVRGERYYAHRIAGQGIVLVFQE